MSFLARLSQSRPNTVCMIVAPAEDGREAWYFVRVEAVKMNRFRKDVFSRGVDLTDYGEVLESGYGSYPPESVILRMTREHGYQPEGYAP